MTNFERRTSYILHPSHLVPDESVLPYIERRSWVDLQLFPGSYAIMMACRMEVDVDGSFEIDDGKAVDFKDKATIERGLEQVNCRELYSEPRRIYSWSIHFQNRMDLIHTSSSDEASRLLTRIFFQAEVTNVDDNGKGFLKRLFPRTWEILKSAEYKRLESMAHEILDE